jgi:uncharacterized protein YabE (DUF348 family)
VRISSFALRPALLGLFVIALIGGNTSYAMSARTVSVTVDGQEQRVSTHADTVAGVLAAAKLDVGSHDLLAPSKETELTDDVRVVLRRGREMALTVDGVQRSVWVTALSVDEALDQVGLRLEGSKLSADRSRAIPLKGFSLEVRTLKQVSLLDRGKVRKANTHAVVVQDLVRELKVGLRPHDRLSVKPTAKVTNGLVLRVTRVDGRTVTESSPIAFATERRPSAALYKGTEKVLRSGAVGAVHRTYRLTFVNGKLSTRKLVSQKQTSAPVTRVVAYGTKARPVARRSVAGTDGLNWGALARCESGGNPRAVSSGGTYRGLYQFSMSTWRGVGGKGDPIDASSGEQTYRAKLLYKRAGRGSWPHCGRYL